MATLLHDFTHTLEAAEKKWKRKKKGGAYGGFMLPLKETSRENCMEGSEVY